MTPDRAGQSLTVTILSGLVTVGWSPWHSAVNYARSRLPYGHPWFTGRCTCTDHPTRGIPVSLSNRMQDRIPWFRGSPRRGICVRTLPARWNPSRAFSSHPRPPFRWHQSSSDHHQPPHTIIGHELHQLLELHVFSRCFRRLRPLRYRHHKIDVCLLDGWSAGCPQVARRGVHSAHCRPLEVTCDA